MPADDKTDRLLQEVERGEPGALDRLLAEHRGFLRRIIEVRMDRRIRSRIDPSDVVQDALLLATQRMADFLQRKPMPFPLWLRETACERLIDLQRQHLGAQCRTVAKELALPVSSSLLLARAVLGRQPTPQRRLEEQELAQGVQAALGELSDEDAEIIVLRSFEELSNHVAGQVLGIEPAAASKRYGRALLRLRQRLIDRGLAPSTYEPSEANAKKRE